KKSAGTLSLPARIDPDFCGGRFCRSCWHSCAVDSLGGGGLAPNVKSVMPACKNVLMAGMDVATFDTMSATLDPTLSASVDATFSAASTPADERLVPSPSAAPRPVSTLVASTPA